MTGDTTVFVARLEEWRQALGVGHNAFARQLAISHAYWHLLRTGDRRPSQELVRGLLARAPEPWRSRLHRAAVADLTTPVGVLA